MPTTTHFAPQFQFRFRSTHSVLRALTVIIVSVAVIAGFLVQVLSSPAPRELRSASQPAALHLRA